MFGINQPDRSIRQSQVDNKLFEQDIAAAVQDAVSEDVTKRNKLKDAQKKTEDIKPSALSLLDDKTEVKDFFESFSKTAAKSKLLKDDLQQLGRTQERVSSELEKLYKQENQSLGKDEVVIRVAQQVRGKEEVDRAKTSEMQLRDVVTPNSEVPDLLQQQQLQQKKTEQVQQQVGQHTQEVQARPQQELVKQYVMAFAETLIRPDQTQKKQAARDVRERLLSSGYSPKHLQAVTQNVQQVIRQDLRKRVKEGFVQFALSYSKEVSPELVKIHKQFEALEEMGYETGALAKEGLPSAKDVKEEAKAELRSVVSDELDRELMETKLKGGDIRELVRAFNKFNELATVVKFEAGAYMKGFQTKLEDLGLHYFEAPPGSHTQEHMDTDARGGGQRQGQEDLGVDDITSLEDSLRVLFMKKQLNTNLMGSIDIRLQIMKAQGKLKKAGKLTDELLEKLQAEGEAMAKTKFASLLSESLEERASLSVLSGPTYSLTKKKFKSAMRGLKTLGQDVSKEEMTKMRDEINRHMFSVVKEEFLKVEALLGSKPADPRLTKQRDLLLSHLERLKKESRILEDIRPKVLQNLQTGESSVVEAA